MIDYLAEENGRYLEHVPLERRTAELCFAAVKQNGWELRYVPFEHRTAELCEAAVKQYGRALQSVPLELRTVKLCLTAVKQDCWALEYVPLELRTAEICLAAVKQDGHALQHIPSSHQTAELCLAAVKENSVALRYISIDIFQQDEIYKDNYLFSGRVGRRDIRIMYAINEDKIYYSRFKDSLENFENLVQGLFIGTEYLSGYLEFINLCKRKKDAHRG